MTIYEVAGIALVFGPIGIFLCQAIWALFLHMMSVWKARRYVKKQQSWQPTRQENLSPIIQQYKAYNEYRKENRQCGIARFAIKPSFISKPSLLTTGQMPAFKLQAIDELASDTEHRLKHATGKLTL